MSESDPRPAAARNGGEPDAEQAEYLRNRQAVLANSGHRDASPLRIVGWIAYALAIVVFVLFMFQLGTSTNPDGPAPLLLPNIAVCLASAGLWCSLGPVLWESRSLGRRVRNLIIAIVANVIVAPLLVPVLISVGSLIADLVSNLA